MKAGRFVFIRLAQLKKQNAAILAALNEYGQHRPTCPARKMKGAKAIHCRCGWHERKTKLLKNYGDRELDLEAEKD